jgi:hypothetical protein
VTEPIRIGIEFEGADRAAGGVDKVTDSVDSLSQKERDAARTTDELTSKQRDAARTADALASEQNAAARAANELASKQRSVEQSMQRSALRAIELTQKLSGAANAIQSLVATFGGESEAAGLIGKLAASSAATAQLGAALGPQGALVGGIIGAAIPAFQSLLQWLETTRDSTVELEIQNRKAAKSFDDLLASRRRSQMESARASRLEMGLGATDEQATLVEQRMARVRSLENQEAAQRREYEQTRLNDTVRRANAAFDRLGDTQQQLRQAQAELVAAETAYNTSIAEQMLDQEELMAELARAANEAAGAETGRSRGGGGGGRRSAREQEERMRAEEEARQRNLELQNLMMDALIATMDGEDAINAILSEQNEEREKALALIEAEGEAKMARMEEERRRVEEEMELQEQLSEKLKEAARAAEEAEQAQIEQISSVNQVIVGGLTDALSAVIAGQKSAEEAFAGMLASFLAYISEQAALEAAINFAQAIAAFARYDMGAGGQHLAAGVAFTAVAVAAGAGAAALSAPATPSAEPEENRGSRDSDRGGGGQVIINWNSPVVTATTRAELGREMGHMIRAGQVRYG